MFNMLRCSPGTSSWWKTHSPTGQLWSAKDETQRLYLHEKWAIKREQAQHLAKVRREGGRGREGEMVVASGGQGFQLKRVDQVARIKQRFNAQQVDRGPKRPSG